MIDLRVGAWQTALADVVEVDATVCDPPYTAHVHENIVTGLLPDSPIARRGFNYAFWTPDDVQAFVAAWLPRTRGWFCAMTSADLIPVWQDAYEAHGRYAFAPVPILQPRVRLGGDGPASCAVYLMVCRPRCKPWSTWGALPGYYLAPVEREAPVIGAKPLSLMRAIIADYTAPGMTVCDPCVGGGSTLIAAHQLGRNAIGAELDPQTAAKAQARIDAVLRQPQLPFAAPAVQGVLL